MELAMDEAKMLFGLLAGVFDVTCHLRSLLIVTPRYFTVSRGEIRWLLISMLTGIVRLERVIVSSLVLEWFAVSEIASRS